MTDMSLGRFEHCTNASSPGSERLHFFPVAMARAWHAEHAAPRMIVVMMRLPFLAAASRELVWEAFRGIEDLVTH
jgi:hypothetical protein